MAIPEQITPAKLGDYLEIMTRAIFQAGLNWALIERKWDSFRAAFEEFDPVIVAAFGEGDVARLMDDPGIIHSKKKIQGTVENARTMLDLDRRYGGFDKYLASHGTYELLSADLKRRFKYLGELSVYYFLFRVHRPVPPFEEWEKTVEGDHPRMREMVQLARSKA